MFSLINIEFGIHLHDQLGNSISNGRKKLLKRIGKRIIKQIKKNGLVDRNDSEEVKKKSYEFAKATVQKMAEVPENKFRNPNKRILMSAIDGVKYVVLEEDIKEMFSNIISASVNSDFEIYDHIAFVEILKQMSAFDAIVFKDIASEKNVPICKIFNHIDSGYDEMIKAFEDIGWENNGNNSTLSFPMAQGIEISAHHVLLKNVRVYAPHLIERSIDNLFRLGVVNVDYSNTLPDDRYEDFQKDSYIESLLSSNENYKLVYGTCNLTRLGKSLATVCLD